MSKHATLGVVCAILFYSFSHTTALASTIILYTLSAPGIQQSEFQGDEGYLTESFDSQTLGAMPGSGSFAGGSYTTTGSSQILSFDRHGGAGGTGKFAFTGSTGSIEVNLAPTKYVGFWFSAGNEGNYVDFYDGTTLLGTLATSNIVSIVGSKNNPNQVIAADGLSYSGSAWYGNPNPDMPNSSLVDNSIFAYVNAGLEDADVDFNRIVFRGQWFEFDNVTTSATYSLNPDVPKVPETSSCALIAVFFGSHLLRRRRK